MTDKGKARLAGVIACLSMLPATFLFRSLAISHFPPKSWLTFSYVFYFLAVIVFTHSAIFLLHFERKVLRGKGLSKQAPRIVDYFVTALLTLGIVQISYAEGWLARYIDQVTSDTPALLNKIDAQARKHLRDDCGQNAYFTIKYCARLTEVTQQPDLRSYVEKTLAIDHDFLEHVTGWAGAGPGTVILHSPISDYVREVSAKAEYASLTSRDDRQSAWAWITLLLLPLVIALRATKTSLEIFADLS